MPQRHVLLYMRASVQWSFIYPKRSKRRNNVPKPKAHLHANFLDWISSFRNSFRATTTIESSLQIIAIIDTPLFLSHHYSHNVYTRPFFRARTFLRRHFTSILLFSHAFFRKSPRKYTNPCTPCVVNFKVVITRSTGYHLRKGKKKKDHTKSHENGQSRLYCNDADYFVIHRGNHAGDAHSGEKENGKQFAQEQSEKKTVKRNNSTVVEKASILFFFPFFL